MEKYHIYDEIGKGEFSQVFKGRERKKIEYVAIKRIEKSIMNKVVAEVQVMHKLNHTNVLKFHDWYETRNNLWLILEYCTGGNLGQILKQDTHLPETSIKIFGLDILAGLKYLHSIGIIHGDIRPQNFLIDEYGILKLADFKFSLKIPRDPLKDKTITDRGIPLYMAPELFTSEGVHSFQSDFWSLGCTLYELRRGFAPFGTLFMSTEKVMENIRTIEPVHNPLPLVEKGKYNSSFSGEFADLVMWLLEKAPMNRCGWKDMSSHPFWKPSNPQPPINLPPQPAFETLIRNLEKSRSEQLEATSHAEFNVSVTTLPSQQHQVQPDTPLRLPNNVDSTPMRSEGNKANRRKGNGIAADEDMTTPGGNPSHGSDHNTATTNSAAVTPNRNVNKPPIQQQQQQQPNTIHQTPPQPPQQLLTTPIRNTNKQAPDESTPRGTIPSPMTKETIHRVLPPAPSTPQSQQEGFETGNKLNRQQQPAQPIDINSVTTSWFVSLETLIMHASDTQVKPIVANKAIESIETLDYNESTIPFEAFNADKITNMPQHDVEIHLTKIYKLLTKTIINTPAGGAPPTNAATLKVYTERANLLSYICSIACTVEVANVVLNTHFLNLILKLMKTPIPALPLNITGTGNTARTLTNQPTNQQLQATIQSLLSNARYSCVTMIAYMLRYATFIQPPAPSSISAAVAGGSGKTTANASSKEEPQHIVTSLLALYKESLKASEVRIRRRIIAALGEISFYISAQEEDATQPPEGKISGNAAVDKWTFPNAIVDVMLKCLRDDSDEIVKHYSAKTIENILSQGGLSYRKRFITYDIAIALLDVIQTTRNDILKATCVMAVGHMFYLITYVPFPSLDGNTTTDGNTPNARTRKGGLNSTTSSPSSGPTTLFDPFQTPTALASVKFIVKVLEKFNYSMILEILKDTSSSFLKLQQGFLNILNIILAIPFHYLHTTTSTTTNNTHNNTTHHQGVNYLDLIGCIRNAGSTGAGTGSMPATPTKPTATTLIPTDIQSRVQAELSLDLTTLQTIYHLLTPIRHFCITNLSNFINILLKLIEQGSNIILRGKALLCCMLLSFYQDYPATSGGGGMMTNTLSNHTTSSVLVLLSETNNRFPVTFTRLLEPIISILDYNPTTGGGGGGGAGETPGGGLSSMTTPTTGPGLLPPVSNPNYLIRISMFAFYYLQQYLCKSLSDIAMAISLLTSPELTQHMMEQYLGTSPGLGQSPGQGPGVGQGAGHSYTSPGHDKYSTPTKGRPSGYRPDTITTPPSAGGNHGGMNSATPTTTTTGGSSLVKKFTTSTKLLQAVTTLLSPLPLSRLMWTTGTLMNTASLANTLALLSPTTAATAAAPSATESVHMITIFAALLSSLTTLHTSLLTTALITLAEDRVEVNNTIFTLEQTLLVLVENLSQLDIPEILLPTSRIEPFPKSISSYLTTPAAVTTTFTSPNKVNELLPSPPPQDRVHIFALPCAEQWLTMIYRVVHDLLPACNSLLQHPTADVRVVITSTLRRMIPYYIKTYTIFFHDHVAYAHYPLLSKQCQGLFHPPFVYDRTTLVLSLSKGIFTSMATLLTDQPPIPQYIIRFCIDYITFLPEFAGEMLSLLQRQGGISILIHLLKAQSTNTTNGASGSSGSSGKQQSHTQEDDDGNASMVVLDIQLITLLKLLFEMTATTNHTTELISGANILLEHDIGNGLSIAFIAILYNAIPSYPFPVITSIERQMEVILALLDLLHTILHHVLKAISVQQQQQQGGSDQQQLSTTQFSADHQRQLIYPLRTTTPALLLLIAYLEETISMALETPTRMNSILGNGGNSVNIILYLLETSTRCLGILFDLYPEIITTQLLAKQSVLLIQHQQLQQQQQQQQGMMMMQGQPQNTMQYHQNMKYSPRFIISKVLLNSQMESKVILKLLKIIIGLSKMSMNLGNMGTIKDFLSQEPMVSTLYTMKQYYKDPQHIITITSVPSPLTGQPQMTSTEIMNVLKLVHHIIDLNIQIGSS